MNRIHTLDGWRAIAILMVTICHAAESIWGDRPDILHFTRFGALGVDVFFALSGLLITKLLLNEHDRAEHHGTGAISLKAFYIRRCFRVLLPCYCYVAAISAFSMIQTRTELLSSLFFFRNYLDADYPGYYTSHLWSLAVEEHFYLLWPMVLVWVTPKHGQQVAQQVAMWGAVGCGLWRIASIQLAPTLCATAFPLFRTDYRMDSLLWGCVMAFMLHRSQTLQRITPLVWLGLFAAYLLCLRNYSLLHRLWMPMLIPLLIAATAVNPGWRLSRMLDLAPMKWIGRISYSLYLWQMVFLVRGAHSQFWWQRFPANIVLAFAVATVGYYLIDAPLQRVGYRLAKRVRERRSCGVYPTLMPAPRLSG